MIIIGIQITCLAYLQLIVWGTLISGGLSILMLVFGTWCVMRGLEYHGKITDVSDTQRRISIRLHNFHYKKD